MMEPHQSCLPRYAGKGPAVKALRRLINNVVAQGSSPRAAYLQRLDERCCHAVKVVTDTSYSDTGSEFCTEQVNGRFTCGPKAEKWRPDSARVLSGTSIATEQVKCGYAVHGHAGRGETSLKSLQACVQPRV